MYFQVGHLWSRGNGFRRDDERVVYMEKVERSKV
jgi:hypothetical protein